MILDNGKMVKGEGKTAKYEFPNSSDLFSAPSNMIPSLGGLSSSRVLLGSKASLQALSLVDREAPLVQAASNKGDVPFINTFGQSLLALHSDVDGKVIHVSPDELIIQDKQGKKHTHELYNNFNLGRKTFIHNDLKVKEGDKVTKGQLIATNNYTDDKGNLAMGKNLRTAVMPYRSSNFEDAFALTQSGANKLAADQMFRFTAEEKFGEEVNKHRYISVFSSRFLHSQIDNIGENGVVKVGTELKHDDPIILALAPKTLRSTDMQLGKLTKVLKNAYSDHAQTWHYDHPGIVTDVSKAGGLVTVNVKTRREMGVGDKISIGYGAKGVCNHIIPDAQAPTMADGKPVDIILNSMSITSRVAPALLVNLGLGKVAQKTGKAITIPHFTTKSSIQETINLLKEHGVSEVEKLYDPVTGRHIEATVGPLYFYRLGHIAADKESTRSQGVAYTMEQQPAKVEGEAAKRIGNLGTAALLSHNATAVLRDLGSIKATKNDEYWTRLKTGQVVPSPNVPFIFHKFISSLEGAGVNVSKRGTVFHIFPQTDKDIMEKSKGAISQPLTFKVRNEKLIPEKDGLFDPVITGILGDRYNHVELSRPIPNPISEDYLRKLLGVTEKQYLSMLISGELKDKLKSIDLDKKIKENTAYLKTGKRSQRENALKVLSFLKMLKTNNMHPVDLMLSKVPVIPAQFRPTIAQGDQIISAPVNTLYKEMIELNNSLKDTKDLPPELIHKLKQDHYDSVKAVYGLGNPVSVKSKEKGLKGLLGTTLGLHGGSAKSTMFQSKVVNKPLDLTGRAVLGADAGLHLDEASVPQEILWKTYNPFIMRKMARSGIPATRAVEYIKARNNIAKDALLDELKLRPAIISRDPALHKFNLLGFYLKPNADPKDKTLKLNPLLYKGFSADSDGDQVGLNVPASEEARKEVIDKMLPSRTLLSPKGFHPMHVPSNEASLGLYLASTEDKKNVPKKYKTEQEVIRDFNSGKLEANDRVEIG